MFGLLKISCNFQRNRRVLLSKCHHFWIETFAHKCNNSETQNSVQQSEFRYTNDFNGLSREQKMFYEENGFIVIPKLVPLDCLERYRQRFQAICEGKIHVPGINITKDISFSREKLSERVINKIQDIIFDNVLFEYCKLPQILERLRCFCGPNINVMNSILINKPPDAGTLTSRHPLHQDLLYFCFRPENKIVCSWTAIEKVNRANGCLCVIPGSHRGHLLEHGYPDWKSGVNKMFHGILHLEEIGISKRVHVEMEAGDTVFFHPLLIHGSGANRTQGFRKAITCHYAPVDCHYINVTGTAQEPLEQEFINVSKKKGVHFEDMEEYWKKKCRLVCGNKSTL